MLFGTLQKLSKVDHFSISVNGSAIKHVTEFKYLDVIFYEHLHWNEHVKATVSEAGRQVGLLGHVRRYITSHSANAIFISMIRPKLEYCAGVWACFGEVNSGILDALQKRVGRIVTKTFTSDTAMEASKWPSLRSRHRRDEHICKRLRKCIDCWCPQYFKNYFVLTRTFVLFQPAKAIFCIVYYFVYKNRSGPEILLLP